MEIKFELDTDKSTIAAVAITTVHAFARVSLAMDLPSLAATNALTTIIILTILYGHRLTPKKPV
jgi:hypothetical protein